MMLWRKKEFKNTDEMHFLDHLEEMRVVIFKCAITMVISAIIWSFFIKDLIALLVAPLHVAEEYLGHVLEIRATSFISPVLMMIYIVIVGSFLTALPVMMFFIASFISPALKPEEKRILIPGALTAFLLFFAGAALAYFVMLPAGMYFSTIIATDILQQTMLVDAQSYYEMVCFLIFGTGLCFELPLLLVILIYIGVVNVETIKKYRAYGIVVIFVVAAIITPPDGFTQIILAVPLILFFEIAMIVGNRLVKIKERNERIREEKEQKEDEEYRARERQKRIEELNQKSEDKAYLEDAVVEEKTPVGYDYEFDRLSPYIDYGNLTKHKADLLPDWSLNKADLLPNYTLNDKDN